MYKNIQVVRQERAGVLEGPAGHKAGIEEVDCDKR
jgi:hypothetical protein